MQVDQNASLFAWDAMSLRNIYQTNNTGLCGGTPSGSTGVVKFQLPTLAGGKVYVGCGDRVLIYGFPVQILDSDSASSEGARALGAHT
jgi:hypothetical protein